jgi:hypothetical protein
VTDFSNKRSTETEIFTVDFTNLVTPGQTISSATWSITVKSPGIDANASTMLSGSVVIVGMQVSTKISGGVAGVTYFPICTATTSDGEVLVLPDVGQGSLPIV